MRSCALLTALLLAGCATPNPIVSASDREVIVNRGDIGIAAAGKLAEEHCARRVGPETAGMRKAPNALGNRLPASGAAKEGEEG